MPHYRFPIRSSSGTLIDDEEGVDFYADTKAYCYGVRTIEDLMQDNPDDYSGWSMEIKDGERLVAKLPLIKAL